MTSPFGKYLAAVLLASFAAAAGAQPRPVVIELFTSQGCSSCPPADAYVGKLSTQPDVLALAFHVDYWDDLGWRDQFALRQSVARQNIYARNLRRSSVYTPQLIVDGRDDNVSSDGRAVAKAVSGSRDGVPVAVSVSDVEVLVEVGADPGLNPADVVLVSYLRHAVSAIGRGENSGRTLEEFNIVRAIRTLGPWKGHVQTFHVPLSSLPRDATDVAVLVQSSGQAQIIGAAAHAVR
jgi:hypothetical protein